MNWEGIADPCTSKLVGFYFVLVSLRILQQVSLCTYTMKADVASCPMCQELSI